jgi:glycosyltransferase involved in cell wall biosynthesis
VLTVLSVAYPLAPVGPDAVGGAEQILTALDHALVRAGHRSLVVACEGSRVAGGLVAVRRVAGELDERATAAAQAATRAAICDALGRWRVDVVHMHGVDFAAYLPSPGAPVLATLHCPPEWYTPEALRPARPDTWLNAVSSRQDARLRPNPALLRAIENGVPLRALASARRKRGFALMLARIAPEKGVHVALAAAHSARLPLIVGGELFPYVEHQRYFAEEVRPRLDRARRYVGPVGFARKRLLLAAAQCVVVPSLIEETSSLVAREALAAGTPVVAFRRGALVDTIEHGRTGFLVDTEAELVEALRAARDLDPALCRRAAEERFSATRMAGRYFEVYASLAGRRGAHAGTGASP